MKRDELILVLKAIKDELTIALQQLATIKGDFVSRKDIKLKSRNLSTRWFQVVEPSLKSFSIADNIMTRYHQSFDYLLRLSLAFTSRRTSFMKAIQGILKGFVNDLLISVYKSPDIVATPPVLEQIISEVSDKEREYLDESLGCAHQGFLRASVMLGWCTAIYRMQKAIEKLGFDEFNKKSQEMKNKTTGRYKRFNKVFEVSTLNELRSTVFDKDMLWVLEYWGLIESNQHDRLSACYVMRNTSTHPGEAIITVENLASFFSDLKAYVFDNPNLQIS